MNDTELQQALQEISDRIGCLPEDKKAWSRDEKKWCQLWQSQKQVLERIQLAREKRDMDAEMQLRMIYGILTSWIGKYPFLLRLVLNTRGKRPLF